MSRERRRDKLRKVLGFEKKNQSELVPPPSDGIPTGQSKAPSIEETAGSSSTASSLNALPSRTKVKINSTLVPGQEPSKEAIPVEPPQDVTQEPVIVQKSLWALAYEDLQKTDPALTKRFADCLGINTPENNEEFLDPSSIKEVAQKALEKIRQENELKKKVSGTSATIRHCFEQTTRIIAASKNYIALATSANPYAALAWTGISLLLPLLLNPTQENEAAIKGLDDIANLIVVYRWQEKVYLHDDRAALEFKNSVKPLYTKILEYEASLLVHIHHNAFKRFADNAIRADDWSSRIKSIQLLDTGCRKVVNAIEDLRRERWRDEEREWQQKLLQQPRQDEEERNIRSLYSNYELSKNVNPERVAGTCEWFSNHTTFLTWRESQDSTMLWLSADPGCGKSVLSKHLIDRKGEVLTVNNETPIICYFFFKDGDIERNNGTKALCAFLHQLFLQQPQLYKFAEKDFKNKGEKFLTDFDALWDIFLNAANGSKREIICVLDALDECQERSKKILAAKLVQLYNHRNFDETRKSILKFIVTSRPEFSIVRDFKELTSHLSEVRLRGEEESEKIRLEIDLVIRSRVKKLGSKMDLTKSDEMNLEKNLLEIPHRTYLWLHLIFDAIEQQLELTRHDIANISKSIPRTVDQAYTEILNKSPDPERARGLLHIILAAARPLTLQEVNAAINMKENYVSHDSLDMWQPEVCEMKIKNMCGLFLSVVDSRVYLIHQTAREFLVSTEDSDGSLRSGPWKGSFPPAHSHLLMANICIWYLQLRDFEVERPEFLDRYKNVKSRWYEAHYRFLSYAAQYWITHFTQAGSLVSSKLIDTVAYRICNTNSWNSKIWISIYDDVDLPDPATWSNLLVASLFGLDVIVTQLLQGNDANTNSRNGYGETPLSLAARNGHEGVVRLLLERNDIEVNSKDDDNQTPLNLTAINGHEGVVRLLLKRNDIEVNSKDDDNQTPLNLAAEYGHEGVVRLLLERNDVELDTKDSWGWTPLKLAEREGHKKIFELLKSKLVEQGKWRSDDDEIDDDESDDD